MSSYAERMVKLRAKMDPPKVQANPAQVILFLTGTAILGIGFLLFFLWLSSRFNFILLDAVIRGNVAIRASFREHREIGNSYFRWFLGFFGIVFSAVLISALIGMGFWVLFKGSLVLNKSFWVFVGFFILPVLFGIFFLGTVMRDFVLPVMYREKIRAVSATNKFFRANTFAVGKVFRYLLMIFGLWILAVVVQTIVSVFVLIGGAIAGAILAVPGILLIKVLPILLTPIIVLWSFIALALILAGLVGVGMVLLPVVIFFRVFALAYLTRLYPECDLLNFSRKA